jgi:hypothetical protein
MKYQFPFIELIVKEKLSPAEKQLWYDLVETVGPPSIVSSTEIFINAKPRMLSHVHRTHNGKTHYVVVLCRDLQEHEAGSIAAAWSKTWTTNKNFIINFSQLTRMKHQVKEKYDNKLKEIVETAAKQHHTAWMKSKVKAGWNFGIRLDQKNKLHPMIMPWENLSEKYQKQEFELILSLFETLNNLGLRIAEK